MKRMTSSSVSADGKLTVSFSDSELNYNIDTRVFDLAKWRQAEATWEEIKEVLSEMKFDNESIGNFKKLLDILLFDNGD